VGVKVFYLILLLIAMLCFAAAAFLSQRLEPYRLRVVAGGLLCWVLVAVITTARALD
jgi:fumarate reductase subunit D